MGSSSKIRPHTFHIPVMGTAFSIDSALRVAPLGIDTVMSLGDDRLVERLRRYYSQQLGLPFTAITEVEEDCRARRITAWLNFVHDQVVLHSQRIQAAAFDESSELGRYYSLLPEGELKSLWRKALSLAPQDPQRAELEAELRQAAIAGQIDVNIMTKVDRSVMPNGKVLGPTETDALTGLRGFAKSKLDASVVFSAGMNPRLYGAMANYPDFLPDEQGYLKKRITLKVSDFRSAAVQGRFLAKKGLWVSEFRVESGLNCGGHAFPAQGKLMGPILEEFKTEGMALRKELHEIWVKGIERELPMPSCRFTAQGGVGDSFEHEMLRRAYGVDSVGWASPFLLVREVTQVDDETRAQLAAAGDGDIELSDASPLGIPFWSLKESSSERQRRERVAKGKPGSPCPHSYLTFNTEFGAQPLCVASREYQEKKLAQLEIAPLSDEGKAEAAREVKAKACICYELGNSALLLMNPENPARLKVAVCPGPNLAWFSRECTLEEMVGHIYGRCNVMSEKARTERPHVFLAELALNVKNLARDLRRSQLGLAPKVHKYFEEYAENLRQGMNYYSERARELFGEKRDKLEQALRHWEEQIQMTLAPLKLALQPAH